MTAKPFLTSSKTESLPLLFILSEEWSAGRRSASSATRLPNIYFAELRTLLRSFLFARLANKEHANTNLTSIGFARQRTLQKRAQPPAPPTAKLTAPGPAPAIQSQAAATTKEVDDGDIEGKGTKVREAQKSGERKGGWTPASVPRIGLAESSPIMSMEWWWPRERGRERLRRVRRLPPHLRPPTCLSRRVPRSSLRAPTERVRMRRQVRNLWRGGERSGEGERAGGRGEGGEVAKEGRGGGEPWRRSSRLARRGSRRSRSDGKGGLTRRGEVPRGLSPEGPCAGLRSARATERLVRDVRERLEGFDRRGVHGRTSGRASVRCPDRSGGQGRAGSCRGEEGRRRAVGGENLVKEVAGVARSRCRSRLKEGGWARERVRRAEGGVS